MFFLISFLTAMAHALCTVPSQLDTNMTDATLASTISLSGINPLDCPEVEMSETWSGGYLIFSDSPESPTTTGKLYKDSNVAATSGTDYNRIYSYHVNSSGSTKRFAVILKNTSSSSVTLTVQKAGVAGPTTSFAYAGKVAVQRWIDSTAWSSVSVPAGSWVEIDSTFNSTNVANGNLYHGIWDYSFPATHEVAICMLATNENPLSKCPTKSVLSRDSHDRGTFDYTDKIYDNITTIDVADGIVQFPVAGDTTDDSDVHGWDNAVASPTEEYLDGNYGVLYRMHIDTVDSDGSQDNLGFCYNPRGGSWAGATRVAAGVLPSSNTTTLLPAGSGSTSDNTKCTVSGRYAPGEGLVPWAQYMPSGGAAQPTRFVVVPH